MHFNITKPQSNDYFSLGVMNDNYDEIDDAMYANQQSAAKVMVGATSLADGESGRVPAPTSADRTKYLKGDGTWDTPSGGGGGSSTLDGLDDVSITSPSNGQVLKYNSTSQEWENANESGGGGGSGIDYSISEQDTGLKWIDGSTVYQKVISISNVSLSSGGYETVDTITGLDSIVSCNGYVVEGNLKYTLNDITLRVVQDGTSVKLYSPSGTTWAISSGAIIIDYTKVSS